MQQPGKMLTIGQNLNNRKDIGTFTLHFRSYLLHNCKHYNREGPRHRPLPQTQNPSSLVPVWFLQCAHDLTAATAVGLRRANQSWGTNTFLVSLVQHVGLHHWTETFRMYLFFSHPHPILSPSVYKGLLSMAPLQHCISMISHSPTFKHTCKHTHTHTHIHKHTHTHNCTILCKGPWSTSHLFHSDRLGQVPWAVHLQADRQINRPTGGQTNRWAERQAQQWTQMRVCLFRHTS